MLLRSVLPNHLTSQDSQALNVGLHWSPDSLTSKQSLLTQFCFHFCQPLSLTLITHLASVPSSPISLLRMLSPTPIHSKSRQLSRPHILQEAFSNTSDLSHYPFPESLLHTVGIRHSSDYFKIILQVLDLNYQLNHTLLQDAICILGFFVLFLVSCTYQTLHKYLLTDTRNMIIIF